MALTTIVALGGVAVTLTARLVDKAEQQVEIQSNALREARLRYQRSGEEKDTIAQYLDGYEELEREGVLGEEKRINWVDGLRLANIQTELFGVDYEIGVQKPYSDPQGSTSGAILLRQSEMKIRLPLLHEADLLRFLDVLERQRVGLFRVDKCALDRTNYSGMTPRYQPNLIAECQLSWITLVEQSAREKKT